MIDYESRKKEIGRRIRQERECRGLTRKDLLPKIFMSEQSHKTLLAWEDGTRLPDLASLARMADLFQCDIGYLLCDFDQHTSAMSDICEATGLSENAVKRVSNLNRKSLGVGAKGYMLEHVGIISDMIESERFLALLNEIGLYLIYGEILPEQAYCNEETELTLEEYNRFYGWANSSGFEVVPRQQLCDMHLETASDELKNMFRDILKKEVRAKNATNKK